MRISSHFESNRTNFKLKKLIDKRKGMFADRFKVGDQDEQQNTKFIESLNKVIEREEADDIYKLIDHVEATGSMLIDEPSEENLLIYKAAVRQFVLYATRKSQRVKELFGSRFSKHRIVETIDEEIENLSITILAGEVDKINLVAYLDNIKGLLIDLIY